MLILVRGSPLVGVCGASIAGRNFASAARRWPVVLARFTSSRILRNLSPTAIGASDVVSTPPPIPDSTWPRAILLAILIAHYRPVPQALFSPYAPVSGPRPLYTNDSH